MAETLRLACLPLDSNVVTRSITTIRKNPSAADFFDEIELFVCNAPLYELFESTSNDPYIHRSGYRQGALEMFRILSDQAKDRNVTIPSNSPGYSQAYRESTDIDFTGEESYIEYHQRAIEKRLKGILKREPGLKGRLSPQIKYNHYVMSFYRGVVDIFYGIDNALKGQELQNLL